MIIVAITPRSLFWSKLDIGAVIILLKLVLSNTTLLNELDVFILGSNELDLKIGFGQDDSFEWAGTFRSWFIISLQLILGKTTLLNVLDLFILGSYSPCN